MYLNGAMGQRAQSAEEGTKLVEGLRLSLGEENDRTLRAMSSLAYAWARQGQYDRAEPLFRKTLDLQRRVQSDEHLQTLQTMAHLGEVYQRQGRPDQAAALLREC